MPSSDETLGILKPMGGGDPVPLRRPQMTIGRRPSCDIRLPFENISGEHCQLRMISGVWHVRDLGSTNGTTVNGLQLTSDHTILPDEELGIAGHLYQIEYEPHGPASIMGNNQIMDEELVEARKRHSLVELAGLDTDRASRRPARAPKRLVRLSAEDADFQDELPQHVKEAPAPVVEANDDDFLKLIEDDVKKDKG